MRAALIGLAISAAFAAIPAQAQDAAQVASVAISQGAYSDAERTLQQELRVHPGRPELMLNLAAVYARTGRAADARTLYNRVLTQEEVLMDLSADRTAGSHAVARTGLRRLEPVQYTARAN